MEVSRVLKKTMRRLVKRPAYFGAFILIVSLAVGACAALYALVDTLLLTPLPYPEPAGLAVIQKRTVEERKEIGASAKEVTALREMLGSAASVGALRFGSVTVEGTRVPLQVSTASITPNVVSLLGVQPVLGSFPRVPDAGGLLVSESFWRERLGGGAIESTILRIEGHRFRINAVIPDPVLGPPGNPQPDLFFSLDLKEDRQGKDLLVLARLAQPAAMTSTTQRIRRFAAAMAEEDPEFAGIAFDAIPLSEYVLKAFAEVWNTLFWALLVLVLASIVNVWALSLVRWQQSRKDFAIQLALGANRLQLAFAVCLETLVCSVVGLAFGLIWSEWLLKQVSVSAMDWIPPAWTAALHVNAGFITVVAFATVFVALAASLSPFLFPNRYENVALARSDSGSANTFRGARLSSVLASVQVAVGVVLLTGAALLVDSLWKLTHLELGHDTEAWVFAIILPQQGNPADQIQGKRSFWRQLVHSSETMPGVLSAGISTNIPLRSGTITTDFETLDEPTKERFIVGADLRARFDTATHNYFRAMGMHLVQGEGFSEGGPVTDAKQAIVNQRFVRDLLKTGTDPVGMRLRILDQEIAVRGVVADTFVSSPFLEPKPEIYVHAFQNAYWVGRYLTVRTTGDSAELTRRVRSKVHELLAGQPVSEVISMKRVWDEVLAKPKLAAEISALFAISFLILSLAGIYTVVASSVQERRGEIGIRMALGASRSRILMAYLLRGVRMAASGIAIGIFLAWVGSRLLEGQLFRVSPKEPWIFIAASLVVLFAAIASSLRPALAASRLDVNRILHNA